MIHRQTSSTAIAVGSIWWRPGGHRIHRAVSENQMRNTGPRVRFGRALARYQWDQKVQYCATDPPPKIGTNAPPSAETAGVIPAATTMYVEAFRKSPNHGASPTNRRTA